MVDCLVGQVPLVFIVVWDLKDSFSQFLDCLVGQVPLGFIVVWDLKDSFFSSVFGMSD